MAKDSKALSKSQTADHLAKSTGTTKRQATQFLDDLTALAYKEAKDGQVLEWTGPKRAGAPMLARPSRTFSSREKVISSIKSSGRFCSSCRNG